MKPGIDFAGKPFELSDLTVLPGDFNYSFSQSIEKNRDKVFASAYFADGTKIEKTFEQFGDDVLRAVKIVEETTAEKSIVITRSDNNYFHLCYIMAILLLDRRLCLLNPTDSDDETQKKTSLLKEPYTIIPVAALSESQPKAGIPKQTKNLDDDFIYVFTSGTTGDSKIVRQTVRGTLSNLQAIISHHELDKKTKVIATPLPVFHVNALHFAFFCSFFSGSHLVLFQKFDPMLLIKAMDAEQIEIISVVPHILASLLNFEPKMARLKNKSFKYFVSAAVGLPFGIFKQWSDLGYKVIQGFGMSEGINFSLKMPVSLSVKEMQELASIHKRPSVGIPVWGNEVGVFSENGALLNDGMPGEIGFRGFNLMSGYKNQGDVKLNSAGFFLSGDIGFSENYRGKNYFFISSRAKEIAKPMGIMVSLPAFDEKIKLFLNEQADVMTFIVENENIGERLGLVFRDNKSETQIASTFEKLTALSSHEIPVLIITTELDLRTASGKLKRGLGTSLKNQYDSKNMGVFEWYFPKKTSSSD